MRDTREYKEYLKSDIWKGKRQLVLDTNGHYCKKCGTNKNLDVHHCTYDRIYRESIGDFQILCRKCHETHHSIESYIRKKRVAIDTFMTKKHGEDWDNYINFDDAWDEFDEWLEDKD